MIRSVLALLILIICLPRGVNAEIDSLFQEAILDFQQENYEAAISKFEDILDKEYLTKAVYFNLGNAHFKRKAYPEAVLNYERAAKLAPFDRRIKQNLRLANEEIGSDIYEVDQFILKRWSRNVFSLLQPNQWFILFVLLAVIGLFSMWRWIVGESRSQKKRSFFIGLIAFILSFIAFGTFWGANDMYYKEDWAIVMEEFYLRSGPDEKSNELRLMKRGIKVEILDQIGTWKKVNLANNEKGWIQESNLIII